MRRLWVFHFEHSALISRSRKRTRNSASSRRRVWNIERRSACVLDYTHQQKNRRAINLYRKMIMHKQTIFAIAIAALLIGGMFFLGRSPEQPEQSGSFANTALAAKFEELSKSGNSSCSATFKESILAMSDEARLKGS